LANINMKFSAVTAIAAIAAIAVIASLSMVDAVPAVLRRRFREFFFAPPPAPIAAQKL
jgi:hypothetical protein